MDELLCPDCRKVVPCEHPVCEDGYDEGDLMCALCGSALSVAGLLVSEARRAA